MKSLPKNLFLFEAFASIDSSELAERFLKDLFTPAEISAAADRLETAFYLRKEISYREIQNQTGTSTATVTRVARSLHHGHHGYNDVLDKISNFKVKRIKNEDTNKTSHTKKRKTL